MQLGPGKGGPGFAGRVWGGVARLFEVDVRAVAAVRIGLALVMLIDLSGRAFHLDELYSDQGFAPRAMFAQGWGRFSPYFWAGSAGWAGGLLVVHAAFALAMLVGFRTRAAIVACMVLTWALTERNPLASHAGDGLLLWMMGWLLFLPAGAVGAVDGVTARAAVPRTVCSAASAGLLLQVLLVYLGAVHPKLRSESWLDLSAVGTIMQLHYATPLGAALGAVLGGHEGLTQVLTALTLLLELFGPPVALCCAACPRVRTTVAVAFVLFHLALATTLYVGTFAPVCAVAWLAFLPGRVWDGAPAAAAAGAWRRVVRGLAAVVDGAGSRWRRLAVRDAWTGCGRVAGIGAAVALAYMTAVNGVEHLSYGRSSPVLPRLPRAKQTWGVMASPISSAASLILVARLHDGSEVTLYPADVRPPALFDYFWPPDSARALACRFSVLGSGLHGQVEGVRRFAQRQCARWDEARPPERRVAAVRVICEYRRALRPDRFALPESLTLAARTRRVLVWQSDPPVARTTAAAAAARH